MNSVTSKPPSSAGSCVRDASPREKAPMQRSRDHAFERALRERAGVGHAETDCGDAIDERQPRDQGYAPASAPQRYASFVRAPAASTPAVGNESSGGPLPVSAEARLTEAIATCGSSSDTRNHWEASINERFGVPVEIRATSVASAGTTRISTDSMLIMASHTVDPALLARHAAGLERRLRERGVAFGHLRVERRDGGGRRDAS